MRIATRVLVVAVAMLAGAGVAGPAMAGIPVGDTTGNSVTFTVTEGTLEISSPGSVVLDTVGPGATLSGQLGDVTIADSRRTGPADWVATINCREFWAEENLDPTDIPSSALTYSSGPATATDGDGTFTPGQPLGEKIAFGNGSVPAFDHAGGTGLNSATWNPTFEVTVPANSTAQTYGSECTHSVA